LIRGVLPFLSVLTITTIQDPLSDIQQKQSVRMRMRMSDPIHPDDWKRYETLLDIDDDPGLWSKVNVRWPGSTGHWLEVNEPLDKMVSLTLLEIVKVNHVHNILVTVYVVW
jgi:hypothetical protein